MIEARGLHKRFGEVVALDGLSFTAEDGKITGLLGHNGAGKTTAMRIIYTLMPPDRGQALVDGSDVASDPHLARRHLGVLSDSRGLYPRLSARENIAYYGKLHGLAGAALERRLDELIEMLDMTAIRNRRAEGFSQGERMKVAIARAIVHAPQNVLLDEPTNGLDVMSTRALRRFLRELRDSGCCVVLSSHVMQEVAALCDEIVIVAEGRIVAAGTPEAIRESAGIASLEEAFVRLTLGDRYSDEGGVFPRRSSAPPKVTS